MKNIKLIINADDYGVTERVSQGIRESHMNGIVTSTSAVMNGETVIKDLAIARAECPNLGMGIHLVISAGRPILASKKVKSLVKPNGEFINIRDLQTKFDTINYAEIRDEWRAQIEFFLSTGTKLDHLDSHHNASYIQADMFRIMADLASEYAIPIRHPFAPLVLDAGNISANVIQSIQGFVTQIISEKKIRFPDQMIASFFRDGATLENLLSILKNLPDGSFELMCHPGYSDDQLVIQSSYNFAREIELNVLTSPVIRDSIRNLSIQLIRYQDL